MISARAADIFSAMQKSAMDFRSSMISDIGAPKYRSLPEIERRIDGPQTVDAMALQLLKHAEDLGFEKGKRATMEGMRQTVEERLKTYFSQLGLVASIVAKAAQKTLPHVTIEQVRLQISPKTREIKLFFLVQCNNFAQELKFGSLLSQIQSHLLNKKRLYADLLYSSTISEPDMLSIKQDYPFILRETANV